MKWRQIIQIGSIITALACGCSGAVCAAAKDTASSDSQPINTQADKAQADAAPASFFVRAYDISGVTRLSAGDVERIVYPYVGPNRTQADVQAASKALQAVYVARGYGAVYVDIPVQSNETFSQGIIKIVVNEAPLGQVRVVGSRYHSLWVARGQIPSLSEGKPINLKQLQTDIAAANRFPDRSIDPQFKPGRVPGSVDVDLKVTDERPLHASLEIDNDNSSSTVPLRLNASVRYTNLFQAGQTATFTYIVAPQNRKESEVFSGSYEIPILSSPWSFSLSGYHSNSNVGSLGGTDVLGNGYQVGLRAIYHLPSDGSDQTLSIGPDFKSFKQKILLQQSIASSSPIHYIPINAQYAIAGATEKSSYAVSLGATLGLRIFNATICVYESGICVPTSEIRNNSPFSNENFYHANISVDYSHVFFKDMVAAFHMVGQVADSHLLVNEQFAGGGLTSVRGYYSSEVVGDEGVTPSLELRSPSLASYFGRWLTEARFFVFDDAAYIHALSVLPGQTATYRLDGAGMGLRWRILNKLSGEVLGSVPVLGGPVSKAGSPRVNFQIKGDF